MNGAAATHNDFDLFVIGAGSSGVRAAQIAAGHGASVAVAEGYRVGGTCVIRGCVPKKLLIYGAHFAEDLKDAWRFGWNVPDCDFDWTELRDNVLADVDRVEKKNGKLSVLIKNGDSLDCDLLLFAIGRRPRSERLGLGDVGVDTDDKGAIRVDEYNRTSVEGIYAVDDVTDRVQLTPVAIREGHAFADTVLHGRL